MGIFFCDTSNCSGYFCSVDMSSRPHAPHCERYVPLEGESHGEEKEEARED